jgi:glyoxylase-like metal-dependent hydrolase (beta-lactamase superfamily II)
MLGDRLQLANNLWLVVGEMPQDNFKQPDIANALIYRLGNRLYLIDSGAGPTIRASIQRALQEIGPVQSFTLLNSHAHTDHVANNDMIHTVQAKQIHHYLSVAGLVQLDPLPHFAAQFSDLSAYYDLMTGFQAHRGLTQLLGVIRDVLSFFVGEQRTLQLLLSIIFRKFQPIRVSRETIQPYEALPRQQLLIGEIPWTGWVLGDNDVWILEERGHTPDEVVFYLPEHQLLHTADLTFPLFPTWPDTNAQVIIAMLRKCEAMTRAGKVRLLTDGHHHQVYHGQQAITNFLQTLITDHEHFQRVLSDIFADHDGLTVGQVYAYVQQYQDDPVVQKFLALEFPHTPPALQNVIVTSLLQMGYQARGPRRKKHFYRPAGAV